NRVRPGGASPGPGRLVRPGRKARPAARRRPPPGRRRRFVATDPSGPPGGLPGRPPRPAGAVPRQGDVLEALGRGAGGTRPRRGGASGPSLLARLHGEGSPPAAGGPPRERQHEGFLLDGGGGPGRGGNRGATRTEAGRAADAGPGPAADGAGPGGEG